MLQIQQKVQQMGVARLAKAIAAKEIIIAYTTFKPIHVIATVDRVIAITAKKTIIIA